jgi:uncharacterized RDD family membrane protein YckC
MNSSPVTEQNVLPIKTQPPPVAEIPTNEFARFSTRFVAGIIDIIFLLFICIPVIFAVQFLTQQPLSTSENSLRDSILLVITLIYHIGFLTYQGATPGQKIVHIRVVDTDYRKIRFLRVLLRETFGTIVASFIFYLGYLWILFDKKKQGWHDKIADTYVIYDRPELAKISSLPLLLIIIGVLEISLPSVIFPFALIVKDYPFIELFILGIIALLGITQITYGLILFKKQKREGTLSRRKKIIARVLIIIGFLAIPTFLISLFFFIFTLLGNVK